MLESTVPGSGCAGGLANARPVVDWRATVAAATLSPQRWYGLAFSDVVEERYRCSSAPARPDFAAERGVRLVREVICFWSEVTFIIRFIADLADDVLVIVNGV